MKQSLSFGLCSLLMLAMSVLNAQAVEITGHRGASHDAPENTLASMRLGWAQKADGVELDIYLSKDGYIVVSHDDNTKRTTGLDKKVAEQTLEELRRLDAGSWKDARFAGERIPTLAEAIATVPAATSKRLVIEIKCGLEVLSALKTALEKSGKPTRQFLIIGFSLDTMRAAKHILPQYEMYWLSSFKQDEVTQAWTPSVHELVRDAKAADLNGLNLSVKGPLDAQFVQQVKAAGLKCYVWTVDSPDKARDLVAAGVDGITTNRPLWMRQQLAALQATK